jgi:dihydroflavonol-4-reductase
LRREDPTAIFVDGNGVRMTSGDPVLVTGGSGFVGSAVAHALAARGFAVRALVRPSSNRTNLAGLACEIVEGDMADAQSLIRALDGVRYLFHVAADYRLWARNPDEIMRNNLEGTRNVMIAARKCDTERIVYTSSVACLKPVQGGSADETSRLEARDAIGAYKQSKIAAQHLVEKMIAEEGLPAVIVSPSTPVGPRDIRPTPTGRIIVEAASGHMPGFVDTGLNVVHVDDVAEGHILALERGRIGQTYILGGQDVTLKDLLAVIAKFAGRQPPRLQVPRQPLFPLAYAAEAIARITGKEPFITADGLRMAKYRMFFSSAKAERELGYKSRAYASGIEDAILWFRQAGTIR